MRHVTTTAEGIRLGGARGASECRYVAISASETMATYWTNFAKYGGPNGEGLPEWPVFEEGEPTVMYLHGTPHTGPLANREHLETIEDFFAWKRTSEN